MSNPYEANGYENREEYLTSLAEEYGVSLDYVVRPLAEMLGPKEDFDGLVTAVQDWEGNAE